MLHSQLLKRERREKISKTFSPTIRVKGNFRGKELPVRAAPRARNPFTLCLSRSLRRQEDALPCVSGKANRFSLQPFPVPDRCYQSIYIIPINRIQEGFEGCIVHRFNRSLNCTLP